MAAPEACAELRRTGHGSRRSCHRALWLSACVTPRWWTEHWRSQRAALETASYEELANDVRREQGGDGCWTQGDKRVVCSTTVKMLSWHMTMLQGGFMSGVARLFLAADVPKILDLTRHRCDLEHLSLRLLLQVAPDLFANETVAWARRHAWHRGLPLEDLRFALHTHSPAALIYQSRIFGVLRALSEEPLRRSLRAPAGDEIDCVARCALLGFANRRCLGRSHGGRGNGTLLAAFYRHRDEGLPMGLIRRLLGANGRLARASGRLALADRLRIAGQEYMHQVNRSFLELRDYVNSLAVGISDPLLFSMLPRSGPPTHLVFHLLDKLGLDLTVPIDVQPLGVDSGASRPPSINQVVMSVLPDRDVVCDKIRWNKAFHCPTIFGKELAAAEADAPGGGKPLRVVEVGSFLGDCLLWAAAWLGPARLRALAVEPVAGATRRLRESAARAGFDGAIAVVTEAVSDGISVLPAWAAGPGGALMASPNYLSRVPGAGDVPPNYLGHGVRLRTLDEVLEEWEGSAGGAPVDFVRIKTASEAQVVAGFQRHLAARRVRRLLVHASLHQLPGVDSVMRRFPWYAVADARVGLEYPDYRVYVLTD